MTRIKTAVFPVAGIGSRFLPATKANPKEMLPIVDKPLIQYAVEEAMRAGLNHMIFITNASKRSIEDHFDSNRELESYLFEHNKQELLAVVKQISPVGISFTYVRQNCPLGLGHAILCAEHVVGNESFAVLLADDLIDDSVPCLAEMITLAHDGNQSVVAVQPVSWDEVERYGVVSIATPLASHAQILDIVEKPQKELATSNLVAVGRYVFTKQIFSCLKQLQPDHRGEIQLTDGIKNLLLEQTVQAYKFSGKRYDCGSKLGYLQAITEFGMRHSEIGLEFTQYLANK